MERLFRIVLSISLLAICVFLDWGLITHEGLLDHVWSWFVWLHVIALNLMCILPAFIMLVLPFKQKKVN